MIVGSAERQGIPVSPGIAIGPAYVLRRERIVIPEHRIRDEQVDGEIERLRIAFTETTHRLEEIKRDMHGTGLVGSIFDAQFLFLDDPTLIQHAEADIREHGLNAEWALQRELRRIELLFESMPDPYLRERASDIGFVVRRVLPPLVLTMHVYAQDPARRFVLLDDVRMVQGDAHKGVTLREIRADGVVLESGGHAFFVPRSGH